MEQSRSTTSGWVTAGALVGMVALLPIMVEACIILFEVIWSYSRSVKRPPMGTGAKSDGRKPVAD